MLTNVGEELINKNLAEGLSSGELVINARGEVDVRKVTEVRHCQGCPWDWKGVCLHPKAKKGKPFPGCVDYEKLKSKEGGGLNHDHL